MVLGIILLVIISIILILYFLFFKEYSFVMGNFKTLIKVIDTRDIILLRLLPEIKNKKIKDDMTMLINERIHSKNLGNDKLVELDCKINKKLDRIYKELNDSKNPIVKEELRRIINLEKKLKIIRREYNDAVETYNAKLLKHPKTMIKLIHMKLLNTYSIK